jgi:hypothetical protein
MILGKHDRERVANLERITDRLLNAHRWLAEFDDALAPMWDYILGRKVTVILDKTGRAVDVMANAEISDVRSKLRTRLGKENPAKVSSDGVPAEP